MVKRDLAEVDIDIHIRSSGSLTESFDPVADPLFGFGIIAFDL